MGHFNLGETGKGSQQGELGYPDGEQRKHTPMPGRTRCLLKADAGEHQPLKLMFFPQKPS